MIERFGSCVVLEEIGAGSLSTVYRAVQEPLGRKVAIKALKPTVAPSSPLAAHLEHEAKLLGELCHPNVIQIHDLVKDEQRLYLVLEHVDGRSLAEILARRKILRPDAVAAIGLEVARALVHVHAKGLVHRDLKPANIMVSKLGEVKIVDFGIARRASAASDAEPASGDAAAFGTPAYMSPEQILGELVDARTDLFSLGVVLYQLAAGARPFDGADAGDGRTVAQRLRRDPAKPLRERSPAVPRALERIVMRLLEKLPADRLGTAAALVQELEDFRAEEGHPSPRASLVRALKEAGLTQIATPFGGVTGPLLLAPLPPVRPAIVGFAALFALLVAGGAAIRWTSVEPAASANEGSGAALPGASLRVVATPWADVWIDGRHVDTTPFAGAIALDPGRHYVKLTHPEAPTEARTIDLGPGEAASLDVTLRVPPTPEPAARADGGAAR